MRASGPLLLVSLLGCRRGLEAEPAHDAEPAPAALATDTPTDATSFEGRPIAPTMSHFGADWLSREERIAEEDPDALHRELGLRPGQTACDIGAGSGYHSVRLARAVAPGGKVLAVDIQPEMLELLAARVREAGVANVQPVLATPAALGLGEGVCDLELLVDVYHELAAPEPIIAELRRALAPGGRLAIVEFRGEDPEVPIKPEHKMTRAQVLRELEPRGFRLRSQYDGLPWQHLLVFERAD
ncbi:MAG: methyltransferase domain-containing protein [Deltaproteobacteria bacterium]|nr:methyltransferase domain-containing protein [Nannocystaceae bacterium]